MLARPLALVSLLALALAPACDEGSKSESKSDAKAETKVEKKDAATLFEGKAVQVPAVFKGVGPGMKADDVKKVIAEFPKEESLESPEYDMRFHVYNDEDKNVVDRLTFSLPKDKAEAMITAAWGAPVKGKDSIDRPLVTWFNPDKGLRAVLEEGYGDEMQLTIEAYSPHAKFLGEGKEIGLEKPKPLLGATVADLRAAYPDVLVEQSQEEAEKTRKGVEKMAGKQLDVLGKPTASVYLDFPPTDFGSQFTRVNMRFDDTGKVEQWSVGIPWKQNPDAKASILDMLKKKWGEPKTEERLGRKSLVFSADPLIAVEENDIMGEWQIEVEAKQPG